MTKSEKSRNEMKDVTTPSLVIGNVYVQNITGTIFKYKVLKYQGIFNNHEYYLVEHVETGFRQTIPGCELREVHND